MYSLKFWNFPVLTLSNFEKFQHFQILTLSNSDTFQFRFWPFPILTLTSSDTFQYRLKMDSDTLQILEKLPLEKMACYETHLFHKANPWSFPEIALKKSVRWFKTIWHTGIVPPFHVRERRRNSYYSIVHSLSLYSPRPLFLLLIPRCSFLCYPYISSMYLYTSVMSPRRSAFLFN